MNNLFLIAVARGLALFLGGFSLLNLLGEWRSPGFDANLWWIDLRMFPSWLGRAVLLASAMLQIAFSVRPSLSTRQRCATLGAVGVLLLATLWNTAHYFVLLAQGTLHSGFPVPFSLFTSLTLLLLLIAVWKPAEESLTQRRRGWDWLIMGLTCGLCLVAFPLAQMLCFGMTDYRRPADVIVVFGAKALASGEPSGALDERIRTGCELYHAGLAHMLVFSGGPGDGSIHETESMRRVALRLGVPDSAILLDPDGLNTQATVQNTVPLFDTHHFHRILAVSHFYHLPRIKMTYRRMGQEVYTVPARRIYPMPGLPRYMAREVAALWVYYLRPLTDL